MPDQTLPPPPDLHGLRGQAVLVTGAEGMLGGAFTEILAGVDGCRVLALGRGGLDVTDHAAVMALADDGVDLIIHCAADVDADRCEANPERCRRVQVGGTEAILDLAAACSARVFYPQSFLIFDGSALPITEATTPRPLSVYGVSKLEAEQRVLAADSRNLAVRMAGFFGGDAKDKNFVGKFCRHVRELLDRGEDRFAVGDRIWQPTYTRDLAANSLLLLATGKNGIYTMASHDEASFYDLAQACVEDLGVASRMTLEKVAAAQVTKGEAARRPDRAVMENHRLALEGLDRQRPWRRALAEYLSRPYFQKLFARYQSKHSLNELGVEHAHKSL